MKQAIAWIVQFSWMFFVQIGIGLGTQPWFRLDYHLDDPDTFGEGVHLIFVFVLLGAGPNRFYLSECL
ncbi:hypothetical protein N9D38_08215 [Rubripirellula sp.]|nr:hypothetical protein [Rubripirellula sp.]